MTDTCFICLQDKPCPCEAAAMSIGRPDVIPCLPLEDALKRAYYYTEAGDWCGPEVKGWDRWQAVAKDIVATHDVLLRHGFVRCDIPACNCGSWHHRYGLPERWAEIKEELADAGVLNNDTGNMPLMAIQKLRRKLADAQAELAMKHEDAAKRANACVPLYTDPPRREWVGLTGPEVDEAYRSVSDREWAIGGLTDARVFFCAIEAKLREKNT